MPKITIHIDETVLTAAQATQLNNQLIYWRAAGYVTEIGPPAKPRP